MNAGDTFRAEWLGQIAFLGVLFVVMFAALIIEDYRAWRRGEVRPPAQRHTRSHHDTRRPR